jgi:hypothetical protein
MPRKLRVTIMLLVCLTVIVGCSGVTMNSRYSDQLDQNASLAAETARRAKLPVDQGGLTDDQKNAALQGEADAWQNFRDARDGKSSATQP